MRSKQNFYCYEILFLDCIELHNHGNHISAVIVIYISLNNSNVNKSIVETWKRSDKKPAVQPFTYFYKKYLNNWSFRFTNQIEQIFWNKLVFECESLPLFKRGFVYKSTFMLEMNRIIFQ